MSFLLYFLLDATQIINLLLNSRIAANDDKVEEHSANGEFLAKKVL